MKRIGTLVFAATVGLGCGGDDGGSPTITIGTIMSQTGSLGGLGQEELQGIQLAIDEINAGGGVLGSTLTIANRDDKSTAEGGMEAASALVALKVPAVIGAIASSSTLAAGQLTSAAGIVQIAPGSTSPRITASHATTTPLLFRTCASDALQGKLLAKRARERGFTRAAIIHVPGAYGKGLADVFAGDFTAQGGQMTDVVELIEGQRSYVDMFMRIYEKNPEAVLVVAYGDDAAQMVRDYNTNFSSKQTFFYFTDSLQVPDFVTLAGGASGFTFQHEGTGPAAPQTQAYETYRKAFKAKYNTEPNSGVFTQNAYDAVYLLAAAMEAAGASSGFAPKLGDVSAGGMKFGPQQWKELRDAIKAGADVDYQGASGDVDLDANGDVIAPYDVWKVGSDGQIQIVKGSVSP